MYETETVLRAAIVALVGGDVETLKTLFADDVVNHMPGTNKISGDFRGKEQFFGDFLGTLMSLTGASPRARARRATSSRVSRWPASPARRCASPRAISSSTRRGSSLRPWATVSSPRACR
jgi:hypothetical protein